MRKLIATITVLLIIFSCSQPKISSSIKQRIYRIENGLIEFKSMSGMFQSDSAQLANPKTLTERMEHYKTPGVSIAVTNEYNKLYNSYGQ